MNAATALRSCHVSSTLQQLSTGLPATSAGFASVHGPPSVGRWGPTGPWIGTQGSKFKTPANVSSISALSTSARSTSASSTTSAGPISITQGGEEIEALAANLRSLLKWNADGLLVATAVNIDTGAIMMQGFADPTAVATTMATKRATFFSRSRKNLWTKGETSGNFINVVDSFVDCDKDSVIYLGVPDGPTCHTGAETCFFENVEQLLDKTKPSSRPSVPLSTLFSLEATIEGRRDEQQTEGQKPSWTRKLLSNQELLCSKIREEADELCRALEENEDKERAASEMADVLYHAMVLLSLKGVKMEEVLAVLRKRFATSGIEEKSSRSTHKAS